MKKCILKPLATLTIIIATIFSCGEDDVNIPDLDQNNPDDIVPNTELLFITDLDEGHVIEFDQVQNGGELITSGFIISSDASDNINNQIYIQDKTEEATSGVVIDVALDNIFLTHGVGREVLVKLNGLGMQKIGNELHIGVYDNGILEPIPSDDFQDFVIRTNKKETIVPKVLTINEILEAVATDSIPTILVSVANVQVIEDQLNTTYANVDDNNNVDKTLMDCSEDAEDNTITLSNSGLSTFKALPFPNEQGTITGILSTNRLTIRSTDDIVFTEDRCIDESVLLDENFESITDTGMLISLDDWININTDNLNIKWRGNADSGNFYADIEKGSLLQQYNAWLITKQIDINTKRRLKLNININVSNHNGNYLKIFIVDDVMGNDVIYDNTMPINELVPLDNTDGFVMTEAIITIPDNVNSFRLGFKYQKNKDEESNTTYQIDDILVTED